MAARNGKPLARGVGPEQDQRLNAELDRVWETVDKVRARNADKSPDEILEDVTAEVEAVRQERYERREATRKSSR